MLAAQMLVESVLQRADVLLVGDPEVLAQLQEIPAAPSLFEHSTTGVSSAGARGAPTRTSGSGGVSGMVSTPHGNAVVLHNPGASAFVWVAGSGQGPVTQVTVSLRLDALEQEPSLVGEIDCPSGRIVVGTPEAVAAWGPEVEPADGLLAQARAYTPDRRHCGLIVVARVLAGPRRVLAFDEALDAVVVECVNQTALDVAGPEVLLAG